MNIYTRKSLSGSINIVPMLDILTILLIFFIVHTEFRRQTQVLKLELPETKLIAGEKSDSRDLLLEVGEDGSLALGGKRIAAGELSEAVKARLAEQPELHVQVAAAGAASMARFIEVLDELTAAGIKAEEVPVRIDYKP